jgi:DNA-binding ferritin-like protein
MAKDTMSKYLSAMDSLEKNGTEVIKNLEAGFRGSGRLDNLVAELALSMLEVANKVHLLHWGITGQGSYSIHQTLGDLYDNLRSRADEVVENYQGISETLLTFMDFNVSPKFKDVTNCMTALDTLKNKIDDLQKESKFSEFNNLLDEIKADINKAKYKLTFLK